MKPRKPIESLILNLRGQKVILDADLAQLYDVPTKRLNEQVKRNADRFPQDFMFQLTALELENLKSQFATSSLAVTEAEGIKANSSQIAMSSNQAPKDNPNWSQFAASSHGGRRKLLGLALHLDEIAAAARPAARTAQAPHRLPPRPRIYFPMAKTESAYDLTETEKRDLTELVGQTARIPTGFRLKAQGCETRATLGKRHDGVHNPNGVAALPFVLFPYRRGHNPVGVGGFVPMLTQGSSCLATLGFTTQSLWDCRPRMPSNNS